MAKKRTKLQKQKALVRRKSQVVSAEQSSKLPTGETSPVVANHTKIPSPKPAPDHNSAIENLIRTELPLLRGDLKRSILTAALIISSLIGIYLYLRYN